MPQPSLSPRNAILWLGENAVPQDLIGKPIFSKWITQYGAQTVVEAENLLETHGIKIVMIPERIWQDETASVLSQIQRSSLHAKVIIVWHTSKGRQLIESRQVEGLEDDETRIREFVRKLAEIKYPLISEDKRAMLDRLAYRTAARLLSLKWDSLGSRSRNPLVELSAFQRRDPYQAEGNDYRVLLSRLDSFRAQFGCSLPSLFRNERIRQSFTIQLLQDAENAYWVETKTRLIKSRKCNYGSWGQFSVSIPEITPQVKFSEATALINFPETIGERNSNKFLSNLFDWLSDDLLLRASYDAEPQEYSSWNFLALQFLERNLVRFIEKVAHQPEPDHFPEVNPGMLEAWGVFGLQVSLLSYVGFFAMMYGMSKAVSLGHSVEFNQNGRFHKFRDAIVFEASEPLLKLLAANVRKAAGAGGKG